MPRDDFQRRQQQDQQHQRGKHCEHNPVRGSYRHGGGGGRPGNSIRHLSSPYNFVPLADDVFIPDWPEPSHDCPFSDAVSGKLHLKLTAKSPIYIRGPYPKPEDKRELLWENENPGDSTSFGLWSEFYRDPGTGKYAIPGPSLKGALRNVLKVAAYGSIGYADDDFISVRDLNDPKYTTRITRPGPSGSFEVKVRAGWLSENPDRSPDAPEWIITPCKVVRVEQCRRNPSDPPGLEEYGGLGKMALGKAMLAAARKYQLWEQKHPDRTIRFDLQTTLYADGYDVHPHSCGDLFYAKAVNLGSGATTGTLVFTGQSGPREKQDDRGNWVWQDRSKHMEFIFYDEEPEPLPVAPSVQKKFRDTHPDDNEGWKYWRRTLDQPNGRVPVFWIEDEKAKQPGERIVAFGLAQMFRLPARNLRDAIPPQHKQQIGLDVADRLFGTIQKDPLRGRVFFTTLTCEQKPAEIRFSRVIQTVLGAPRPTFYPAYLEQPEYSLPEGKLHGGKKNARTWLSPEVRIRGWKRYPVWDAPADQPESIRHEHPIPVRKDNQPNYDVATAFRPLKAGAAFTGSVRFHNLTCKELGALVWALTWGGDPALRHSLGMGKSLGLGSCVIEIDWERSSLLWCGDPSNGCAADVKASESDAGQRRAFLNRCQEDFQGQMDNFTKKQLAMESERKSWLETESMKELLAMANPGNADKLAGHKEFPPLPGFRHIKSLGFVLLRTREILERKSVTNCQTTSGNPQLEGRHLAPADDETSGCD